VKVDDVAPLPPETVLKLIEKRLVLKEKKIAVDKAIEYTSKNRILNDKLSKGLISI
jgi:hypothetical protein